MECGLVQNLHCNGINVAGNELMFGSDGADGYRGGDESSFLFGRGGADLLDGGNGDDFLEGGSGNDILSAGAGENTGRTDDVLTGGQGADTFVFTRDDLGQSPNISIGGITGSNTPDQIEDFSPDDDVIAIVARDFGITGKVDYLTGKVGNLDGDGNVVVLQDSFKNGFEAAAELRDNQNFTGDEGFFVYFNENLGFNRLVYSEDLDDGGAITVIANLPGSTLEDAAKFVDGDFVFI